MQSGKKKVRAEKEENVTLGPTVREGEHVFGVAHIFASFNDTFVVSVLNFWYFYGSYAISRFTVGAPSDIGERNWSHNREVIGGLNQDLGFWACAGNIKFW